MSELREIFEANPLGVLFFGPQLLALVGTLVWLGINIAMGWI